MEKDLTNIHQSHGFTHGDYARIQAAQQAGEVEMTTPNRLDKLTDPLFKEDFKDYQVAAHERGFYHVAQEVRSFDIKGKRNSVPTVQKYSTQNFKEMIMNKGFAGWDTEIIHDPTLEKGSPALGTKPFVHGETDESKPEKLDQALIDYQTELQNKEKSLAEREEQLQAREAELLAKQEEQEATNAKLQAQAETEKIIASLPVKTIAELKEFADQNEVDLNGVTLKDEIIARITEKLKPTA